jgi:hydrogenase expression/formation protein HypC
MCLALPARVVELHPGQVATVDLDGVRRNVSTALLEQVEVGDYVILHVGFALTRLDVEEAQATLALFASLPREEP